MAIPAEAKTATTAKSPNSKSKAPKSAMQPPAGETKPAISGLKSKKALPKFAAATLAATRAPAAKPVPVVESLAQLPNFETPTPATQPLTQMVTDMMAKTASPANRYEEIASFGKANMEALIEANTVFLNGFQELSKEMFSLTKASLEEAAATTSAMLSAKTLKDVVDINTGFAKGNYEKMVHNTTKLGELTVKLATAAAAPITARATHLVEKSVRPAV